MKKLILFLLLFFLLRPLTKAQTAYEVSTFAGSGVAGSVDGQGTAAQFYSPEGICIDASGNLYVLERNSNKIRKITPGGAVSTLAGSGVAGYADGTGTAAQFKFNVYGGGICIDSKGNLYVIDAGNHLIRKITPGGVVSTFVDYTKPDFANVTGGSTPTSLCADGFGNLYTACGTFIIKITPQAKATVFFEDHYVLYDLTIDKNDNIYGGRLTTSITGLIKVTPGGVESTIPVGKMINPTGICVDDSGNVYICDFTYDTQTGISSTGTIKKISPSGSLTSIAGSTVGDRDGVGANAQLDPVFLCIDASGNLYTIQENGNKIKKITRIVPKPPVVNYLDMPGNLCLGSGVNYQATTTGGESKLAATLDSIPVTAPKAICKNDSSVFVLNANDSILCFNLKGKLRKVYNTMPNFTHVTAIAADNQDRVYVVAPDLTYPALTSIYRLDSASNWDFTFGGSGSTVSGIFANISAIAMGPDGYLYAADTVNGYISKIDPATAQATNLPSPDPKHAFDKPVSIAWGKNSQMYIADLKSNKILVRNAADNNYYDALPGLDTLDWKINSIDIDTNAQSSEFFMSSKSSPSPVASFTSRPVPGFSQSSLFNFASVGYFHVANPAGLVNTNNSGLAPMTWVANTGGNNVKRFQLYGYTITPKLPKGLYFDFMTGDIAGTPAEAIPPTTYTITTVSSLGTSTKKITFGITPSTNLSNTPGTGTSLKDQADGLKITYTDPSNCSKMVSIDDSVGGTSLGKVQVKQTVYPTVATFSSSSFVGRKTEINTQDPNATARLKLYFTYKDIDNYNKFTNGAKLSNDTIKGTMQIGVLQLHTDSTGHIEEIKHNPITATWVKKDENWMVDFQVDKFSTFYAGGSGMIDSFTCANTGHDSVVTTKAYNFNGQMLKKSGTYVTAFVNKTGCDSVVTLKLTSNCSNTGSDSVTTDSTYYVWNGDSLKTSGTYVDTLDNKGGCDSVVTLKLTLTPRGGIIETSAPTVRIYPNPSSGVFTIDLNKYIDAVNYTVLAADGRVISERQNISRPVNSIDLSQEKKGIYFLKISGHSFISVYKLIKE